MSVRVIRMKVDTDRDVRVYTSNGVIEIKQTVREDDGGDAGDDEGRWVDRIEFRPTGQNVVDGPRVVRLVEPKADETQHALQVALDKVRRTPVYDPEIADCVRALTPAQCAKALHGVLAVLYPPGDLDREHRAEDWDKLHSVVGASAAAAWRAEFSAENLEQKKVAAWRDLCEANFAYGEAEHGSDESTEAFADVQAAETRLRALGVEPDAPREKKS